MGDASQDGPAHLEMAAISGCLLHLETRDASQDGPDHPGMGLPSQDVPRRLEMGDASQDGLGHLEMAAISGYFRHLKMRDASQNGSTILR